MTKKVMYKIRYLDGYYTNVETNGFVIDNGVIFFYIDSTMVKAFVLHNIVEFGLVGN